MQTLFGRLGQSLAAAFMAFAIVAVAQGALDVAGLTQVQAAARAAVPQV